MVKQAEEGFESNGMVRVKQESDEFITLLHRFYSSIRSLVPHCSLVDVHRIPYSTRAGRARRDAYELCLKATALQNGGVTNEKLAFCEASRKRITRIVKNGFDVSEVPEDGGYYGIGLYLTPESVSINSVMSSVVDGEGLRHVLMCRAILGRTEEVVRASGQSRPSSKDFDSGVVNQGNPTIYVMWYSEVNIRVIPLYVLSFKVDFRGRGLNKQPNIGPTSPWIPLKNLIDLLSKVLTNSDICKIKKSHCEFMERKISRQQLVLRIKLVTGDEILHALMRALKAKKEAAARFASPKS
ncbi:hypothetical protein Cni_G06018 [Canna indica]|uniref:Poly [ADP-ribose] polymerase n=1 Tax=Canna indica TaxID=4628 RepID=A0AAQ3K0I8_9LILI|nr:hypothetical protein Cni_G06018 [Canna indica]